MNEQKQDLVGLAGFLLEVGASIWVFTTSVGIAGFLIFVLAFDLLLFRNWLIWAVTLPVLLVALWMMAASWKVMGQKGAEARRRRQS